MLVDRVYRSVSARPRLADAALAAVLLLVLALPYAASAGRATLVLALPLLVPLAWRRSAPVPAAAVVFVGAFVQWLVSLAHPEHTLLPADVGVLLAVYALAGYGPRWASRAGLATGLLGAALLGLSGPASAGPGAFDPEGALIALVAVGGLVLATWTSGDLRRIRRQQVDGLRDRAERLEREREQEARLAAAAERVRIARELHDVVAHSLSVVIAQADGGRYAASSSPGAAERALGTIAETSRTALADLRRALGVLREEATGTAPQPDLSAVPALVAGVRDSGLPVALVEEGVPRTLPAAQGLAAFRVVQEGLTNVLKHAGPGTATTVALRWWPDALHVQVDDDGRCAAPPDGRGHGLRGVQERAGLFGGTAEAGPRHEGGFRLRVRLPYP